MRVNLDALRRAKATDGLCALRLRLFLAPHLPEPRGRMLDHLVPAPPHAQAKIDCRMYYRFLFPHDSLNDISRGEPVSETACMRRLQRASAGPQGPGLLHSGGNLSTFMFSAACILLCMASRGKFRESRRSTRVPLKLTIAVEEDGTECLTCDGETIFVNLHGALISTATALRCGSRISIHVYLTDKVAGARVVYVDPGSLLHCGIELDCPRNIWGVPLPPDDWRMDVETGRH